MLKEIIEKLMEERGWTYYRLAKQTDISLSTLYAFRRDEFQRLSWDNMEKLADTFEVSLDIFRKNQSLVAKINK